jgi:ATP-dependent 26S proteasome regulatory subunit
METQLELQIRSGSGMIWVSTPEEDRSASRIKAGAEKLGCSVFEWNCTAGFVQVSEGKLRQPGDGQCRNIDQALGAMGEYKQQRTVFIVRDLDLLASRLAPTADYVVLTRRIKDIHRKLKQNGNTAVFLAGSPAVPPELGASMALVEAPLPDNVERLAIISTWIKTNAQGLSCQLDDEGFHHLVAAAAGMTSRQIQAALAVSVVKHRAVAASAVDDMLAEKVKAVKTSEILEYIHVTENFADVGGLEGLKEYIQKRASCFSRAALRYGLPTPKGILILGPPGTGKSLTAKATASVLQIPLIRLDFGRVHGSLVGESEERMRRSLALAEAQAPVVLWIDELDKALGGVSGPSGDSGVSKRLFGNFLTWSQERTKMVFLVATANDVTQLPPPLLRRDRFDEIFFVDLPTPSERKAILEVVLRKHGLQPKGLVTDALIEQLDRYTGAEMNYVVTEAMFDAFDDNQHPVTAKDLKVAATKVLPLADQMRDEIEALRRWGKANARSAS